VIGFYIAAAVELHEYPAQRIIICAETGLVKNETTLRTQTRSCQAEYFAYLYVGHVMEHPQRKERIGPLH
jgi:hypothetical protein